MQNLTNHSLVDIIILSINDTFILSKRPWLIKTLLSMLVFNDEILKSTGSEFKRIQTENSDLHKKLNFLHIFSTDWMQKKLSQKWNKSWMKMNHCMKQKKSIHQSMETRTTWMKYLMNNQESIFQVQKQFLYSLHLQYVEYSCEHSICETIRKQANTEVLVWNDSQGMSWFYTTNQKSNHWDETVKTNIRFVKQPVMHEDLNEMQKSLTWSERKNFLNFDMCSLNSHKAYQTKTKAHWIFGRAFLYILKSWEKLQPFD